MNPGPDPAAIDPGAPDEEPAPKRADAQAATGTTALAVVEGVVDAADLASVAVSAVGAGVSGAVEVASAAASVIGGIFSIFDS